MLDELDQDERIQQIRAWFLAVLGPGSIYLYTYSPTNPTEELQA